MPTPAPGAPPISRRARPRYQVHQPSRWERIPFLVKVLVPLAMASGGWWAWRKVQENRAVIAFVRADQPVPRLELTFFPDTMSFAAPSPPPPLGVIHLDGDDAIAVGPDVVPGTAYVRYRAEGIGTGYAHVRLGRAAPAIDLRPPAKVSGRVGEPVQIWLFGWRSVGMQPLAGARVLGLGGGELGVPLCETTTDADGRFELAGFDGTMPALGVRVLMPGYALAWQDWQLPNQESGPIVALVPTTPIRGRVALPPGLDPAPLRLLARGLPGVEATIAVDGSFALDHVSPELEPKLLVYGLPAQFTHPQARGKVGGPPVEIPIQRAGVVRGFVVDLTSQRPLAGAVVWHPNGPSGMTAVTTDAAGAFVVDRVPPGELTLGAHWEERLPGRKVESRAGQRVFAVAEGQQIDNIIIRVE